jgi:hypothetical protein
MFTLFLAAAFAVSAEAKADASVAGPKLDGTWLIVYAEEGGRRNNAWEQNQATFKGDTLTYGREGKFQSMKLTFGKHQTVKASKEGKEGEEKGAADDSKSYNGVYIAGQDYFCLSLEGTGGANKGAREVKKEGEEKNTTADAGKGEKSSSGSFILILRKHHAAKERQP